MVNGIRIIHDKDYIRRISEKTEEFFRLIDDVEKNREEREGKTYNLRKDYQLIKQGFMNIFKGILNPDLSEKIRDYLFINIGKNLENFIKEFFNEHKGNLNYELIKEDMNKVLFSISELICNYKKSE